MNVSVWVRSRLRAGLAEQQGGAAPGVASLPEALVTKAPLLQSWSPYKLEAKSWGSYWMGDTRKLPENLEGATIEITTRGGDSWTAIVLEVVERREDFLLIRDSGK